MPFSYQWDAEVPNLIRLTAEGKWGWDEFYTTFDEVIKLLDQSEVEVDFITDLSKGGAMPPMLFIQSKGIIEKLTSHPRSGNTVYVGATRFLQMIADAFGRINPELLRRFRYEFAPTVDEARSRIRVKRAQQPGQDS